MVIVCAVSTVRLPEDFGSGWDSSYSSFKIKFRRRQVGVVYPDYFSWKTECRPKILGLQNFNAHPATLLRVDKKLCINKGYLQLTTC